MRMKSIGRPGRLIPMVEPPFLIGPRVRKVSSEVETAAWRMGALLGLSSDGPPFEVFCACCFFFRFGLTTWKVLSVESELNEISLIVSPQLFFTASGWASTAFGRRQANGLPSRPIICLGTVR